MVTKTQPSINQLLEFKQILEKTHGGVLKEVLKPAPDAKFIHLRQKAENLEFIEKKKREFRTETIKVQILDKLAADDINVEKNGFGDTWYFVDIDYDDYAEFIDKDSLLTESVIDSLNLVLPVKIKKLVMLASNKIRIIFNL